jgi:hypothetical protein
MSWTRPTDLRAQLMRRWERGELLRSLVSAGPGWPLRLTLKGPTPTDLSERFDAVRGWVAELTAMPHVRIEWRGVRHRVQGQQRVPARVWVDGPDDALAIIGKRRDAQTWRHLWEATRAELPAIVPWLARRPLQALELADRWPRLLRVVRWLLAHPRPGVYLRQVDAPGVDSKFIEGHRAVLAELLDLALPPDAVDRDATGAGQFARRYGFREKPERIRFRVLDPAIDVVRGAARCPDVTLDAASFAALELPVRRVFITENETNFLAFPATREAIVVFGAGYGWDAIARATWLSRCAVHYWGDIDTHGFAILDQLRGHLEAVSSLLMDRETLLAHEAQWGEEPDPVLHDLHRLTADERALFDDLRDNRIGRNLRLEQERVGFGRLERALREIVGAPQS